MYFLKLQCVQLSQPLYKKNIQKCFKKTYLIDYYSLLDYPACFIFDFGIKPSSPPPTPLTLHAACCSISSVNLVESIPSMLSVFTVSLQAQQSSCTIHPTGAGLSDVFSNPQSLLSPHRSYTRGFSFIHSTE